MDILHPIYIFIFIVLLVTFLISDTLPQKQTNSILWFCAVLMIIACGGRDWVGADYPVYREMYEVGFPLYTSYSDVLDKALFRPNAMDIEWAFVLLNKLVFDFGLTFYTMTFIMAGVSITLQLKTFLKYSAVPVLSFLFYYMATYFFTESGQMRQGMGTAICVFSIRYIIKRDIKGFLLCMYFALGMHKSTVVFIPAYWLVKLPLDGKKWIPIIILAMISAPFQIYTLFGGFISSIAPQDVSSAYTGYSKDTYYGQEMKSGLGDVINLTWMTFMLLYDKKAERKIPYYEYYRNLSFFGLCLYYVFRGNTIFATRLPGSYMSYTGFFAVPGVAVAVGTELFRIFRVGFITYFVAFSYAFASMNARSGHFTLSTYKNILW